MRQGWNSTTRARRSSLSPASADRLSPRRNRPMIDKTMRTLLGPGPRALCCALLCLGWRRVTGVARRRPTATNRSTSRATPAAATPRPRTASSAGNVVVTQGTLSIHADRITFHQNPDNSLSATAYGNPVTFREKRDGVDEYYEGFAQRIVYDGQKRFVELFDNALLKKRQRRDSQQLHFLRRGDRVVQGRRSPGQRDRRLRASTAGRAGSRRIPAGIEGRTPRTARAPRTRPRRRRPPQAQPAAAAEGRRQDRTARRQSEPSANAMSTLSVAALNKRYKSRIVVHDVSLAVGSGESRRSARARTAPARPPAST